MEWFSNEQIKRELDKLSISNDAPAIKVDGAIWMQLQIQNKFNIYNNWIKVCDMLPEFDKRVICYTDKVEVLIFTEIEGCICVTDGIHFPALLSDVKVTHWMPLPEPPVN